MKIIELTETQFKNYSALHSSRNYFQTVEFAKTKPNYESLFLGFINEENSTLMAATLILIKPFGKFKIGYIPGGFLIDYENEELFRNFTTILKEELKKRKFIYLTLNNNSIYKIFAKNGELLYFDTNTIKLLDELGYTKSEKNTHKKVVLETEKTPEETYKMFNQNTKKNIKVALRRSISIYQDKSNNIDILTSLLPASSIEKIKKYRASFTTKNNKAEIYLAKLNPEQYINNYRFLLKEEELKNDKLNSIMQNINIKKSISFIRKKMLSDQLITTYNNEIIKATNIYSKYSKEILMGAIVIIKNNREIYFLEEGYNKELASFYSSHLIKWEIIKKHLESGYKIFNFGKISTINSSTANFKLGFGGRVYEYLGNYDLIINKWLYRMAKLITIIKSNSSK